MTSFQPTSFDCWLRAFWLTSVIASAMASAVGAQERAPYRFGDVVDVQLINVEAWVTDGKGQPIRGLSADDFVVLEDGKPVEISHFSEVVDNREVSPAAEPVTSDQPAGGLPKEQGARGSTVADTQHLVLYFDQLHLKPSGRKRLIKDLREFIRSREVPAERVLVLNQDFGLTTEVTFGSTQQEIDDAFDRIGKSVPAGGRVATEKRLALQRLQDLWKLALERGSRGPAGGDPCDFFVPRAGPEVELFARESRDRISITLDHLASAASFLTGVPGVKTLLYLSDSLERSPGSDLLTFVTNLCPLQDDVPRFIVSDELSLAFRQLTRHANTNRVTIYALQAGGLEGSFVGSASQGSLEQQGTRGLDTALRFNERDGLTNLAAETGGRAIFNRNRFDKELGRIAQEMSTYYSLGYTPPHGGDGAEHRIEVKVEVEGQRSKVRYRRGYRDKSADVRMTERLQGAVYLGLVSNPMGVRLGAGTVRSETGGRITVPLHVLVPAENVTFLPEQGTEAAHLSVMLSTRSTTSQKGIFEHSAFRVPRPAAEQSGLLSVAMELTVPQGVHVIAVGLRDDATRETSFVTTTLELRAAAEG